VWGFHREVEWSGKRGRATSGDPPACARRAKKGERTAGKPGGNDVTLWPKRVGLGPGTYTRDSM